MFSLICSWMNGWVNNREARDLRRHDAHNNVIVVNSVVGDTRRHKKQSISSYLHSFYS